MAKSMLNGYKIGGDIIDMVSAPVGRERPESDPSLFPEQNPVVTHVTAGSMPAERQSTGIPAKIIENTKQPLPDRPNPDRTAGDALLVRDQEAVAAKSTEPDLLVPNQTPDAGETSADQWSVVKDAGNYIFTISELKYRVGGVKPLFVTSLRVNIRAGFEKSTYYDSLDLYAAKARTSFAAALHRQWNVDPSRVEKDLVTILEHLETERDEAVRATSRTNRIEVNTEDRELGLAMLRGATLFDQIVSDMSALGYVGEALNKQLVYLAASSRKLADPISVLILSQSASGKSYLVDTVKKLIPPEDVVAVTSLSDQALNYVDDLMHKFLILGEAVHGEVIEHQIREMLSGKELSRLVTIKDPETGTMKSQVMRRPVVVSTVMSSTSHAVNPENASRAFVINTDESREQTARIHEAQRSKYSLERFHASSADVPRIIRTHHAAQRLLRNINIVNDFAPLLDFPTTVMRLRRDHDRFLDLIASVCFLRQYQKREEHEQGVSFIRCDAEDYRIAYSIMVGGVLRSTLQELPAGAQQLYGALRDLARIEAGRQSLMIPEVTFTQRQIREHTGMGQTWVKTYLRQLVDYEYLSVIRGGTERSKGLYRLKDDAELTAADLSMIPTPDAMTRKLVPEGARS